MIDGAKDMLKLGLALLTFSVIILMSAYAISAGKSVVNMKLAEDANNQNMELFAEYADFYDNFIFIDFSNFADSSDPSSWVAYTKDYVESVIPSGALALSSDDFDRLYLKLSSLTSAYYVVRVDDNIVLADFNKSKDELVDFYKGSRDVKYFSAIALDKDSGLIDGVLFYVDAKSL